MKPDPPEVREADWVLLRAARQGDREAWERLWERHRHRLYRVALALLGEAGAARDVVQAQFLRLVSGEAPPREEDLGRYLSTAVWRLALSERRRAGRQAPLEEAPEDADTAEDAVERAERVNHALEALDRLPEAQRQVLALRLVAGLSYDEVAALLGIPVGTVRSRLFNGVAVCRDWLRRKGRLA
jgi:RNA polymerase sigma-70 factor (ECF subfamily)